MDSRLRGNDIEEPGKMESRLRGNDIFQRIYFIFIMFQSILDKCASALNFSKVITIRFWNV